MNVKMTDQSYLMTYHEMVKNTFSSFSTRESFGKQLCKRIGLVVIAPFAYLALAFAAGINSLKNRFSKTSHEFYENTDSKNIKQILNAEKKDLNPPSLEKLEVEQEFWKNITPKNINQILDIQTQDFNPQSLENFEAVLNVVYFGEEKTYCVCLVREDKTGGKKRQKNPIFFHIGIVGDKFRRKYSDPKNSIEYENFDQVLQGIFKGDFLDEFREIDFLKFTKASGEKIIYKNQSKC